jgi:23S rRNA (uridine2552-2'-O)-methyltransferase
MSRPGQLDARYHRAKQEGFAARSIYKLEEIDRRYQLFRPGQKVLDLGAHPGSWLQFACARVGASGLVVGVDLNPLAIEVAPPIYFILGEVGGPDLDAVTALSATFDAVVSDMAPKTTGIRDVDQQRSLDLARAAWQWAEKLLKPGGVFLVKVFEGPGVEALAKELTAAFRACRRVKPEGSRSASKEIYLLALNRRKK